jgi:protein-S-isoprenylcysteine O-methyltransferase Ste14
MASVGPATPTRKSLTGRGALLSLAQDAALVALMALFALAQFKLVADGVYRNIPFALEHALLAVLFLTRRRSRETSTRFQDWSVAAVASWLPFAYQARDAGDPSMAAFGTTLQLVGLSMAIVAFGFLGRSMGIVAADRGLKTQGAYRVVRHPAYAAHIITGTGFLIANPHWINATIWVVVFLCQVARIHAEERLLRRRTEYEAYASRVRWRLLPGVY